MCNKSKKVTLFLTTLYLSSVFLFLFLIAKIIYIQESLIFSKLLWFVLLLFPLYWLTIFFDIKKKINLNLFLLSIFFSLFVSEVMLEITGIVIPKSLNELRQEEIKKLNIPYDHRTKLNIIKDYKEKLIEASPSFHPITTIGKTDFFENENLFPLGNLSNTKIILCNENGFFSEFFSDKFGFNNPEFVYEKNIDIMLIGDSFTEGACVSPENNFRAVISNYMNKNVANFGNGGNGPLLELATLIEYGRMLKPKKIIWIFTEGNDLSDLNIELSSKILRKYLSNFEKNNQDLSVKQNEIDNVLRKYIEFQYEKIDNLKENKPSFWNISIENIIYLRHLRYSLNLYNNISVQPFSDFKKVLKKAKAEVNEWGGDIFFVYLPMFPEKNKNHANYIHDKVLNIVNDLSIASLDLRDSFVKNGNDPLDFYPFRLYGHYNKEGYKFLSKEIANFIKLQEVL